MWTQSPDAFIADLKQAKIRRAYLITDPQTKEIQISHELLKPLASWLREHDDYYHHQGIFFEIGEESEHLLCACIHQTNRGQAAGGTRFWSYRQLGDLIRDGLRLSRGMGHKNALAGLWWGGGKGVIARKEGVDHLDPKIRETIYRDYGRMMTGLKGAYITAEDVGTTPPDMANIFTTTRHTTCIPPQMGGSGNPSGLTASGVVVGMEAALDYLKLGTLKDKTIAMQGLGNVANFMIGELLKRGVKKIIGADIDQRVIDGVYRDYQSDKNRLDLRVVELDDMSILGEEADIVAPNATGATINPDTIPTIKAKIICGAANNQLANSKRDGDAVKAANILYVPDFLCNRMGIVNCANEQYGWLEDDPAIKAHLNRETTHGVFQRSLDVFKRAEKSGSSTAEEAVQLAEELMQENHPIWPNRVQEIIEVLVKEDWANA